MSFYTVLKMYAAKYFSQDLPERWFVYVEFPLAEYVGSLFQLYIDIYYIFYFQKFL